MAIPTAKQLENLMIEHGLDPHNRHDLTAFMTAFENNLDAGVRVAAERAAAARKEGANEDGKTQMQKFSDFYDTVAKAHQSEPPQAGDKDRSKMSGLDLIDQYFRDLEKK